jgi:hypothetical protein
VIWPNPTINAPKATKVFVVRNDNHLMMLDDTDFFE